MQIRNRALLGVVAALALPLIVVGCSGDDDDSANAPQNTSEPIVTRVVLEGETPVAGSTQVVDSTPPAGPGAPSQPGPPAITNEPPSTVASSAGGSVEMGIGTYCWVNLCVDKIGPITRGTLTVAAGSEVIVAVPAATPALNSVSATAFAGSGPLDVGGGETAWQLDFDGSVTLDATRAGDEIRITAPLEPGSYVLSVGMFFESGDVQYGVVLEVQ